jgi:acetyl esterase
MPLHPKLAELAAGMAANPDSRAIHDLTPKEARDGYRALVSMLGPASEGVRSVDRAIPGPERDIPLRIYTPDGVGPFGVLVFYHGGGWVIGDLETHDRECRILCREAGCVVVSVDYRLAPEHVFPAAVEDAFAALRWVSRNAAELDGDPARLAVGGDSAGGNLAAVMTLLARDAGGPALRHQLLIYPAVDARDDDRYASREQNALGPFLLRDTMDYFTSHYLRGLGSSPRADTRMSPLLATSHRGLPPALVITAEFDPLRDEGEAYARALEKSGVPVTLHRYDGMAHLFFQLSPVLEESRQLLAEASAALRGALS